MFISMLTIELKLPIMKTFQGTCSIKPWMLMVYTMCFGNWQTPLAVKLKQEWEGVSISSFLKNCMLQSFCTLCPGNYFNSFASH